MASDAFTAGAAELLRHEQRGRLERRHEGSGAVRIGHRGSDRGVVVKVLAQHRAHSVSRRRRGRHGATNRCHIHMNDYHSLVIDNSSAPNLDADRSDLDRAIEAALKAAPEPPRNATEDEWFEYSVAIQRHLNDHGLVGLEWPLQYGGRGLDPVTAAARDADARCRRGARAGELRRHRCPGARAHRVHGRRPAGPLVARYGCGDGDLVPAVQRAGRGVGPGQPAHAGPAGRRWLAGLRAEGVEHLGAPCHLGSAAGPDGNHRDPASGHHGVRR